jgi:hypothetical protein
VLAGLFGFDLVVSSSERLLNGGPPLLVLEFAEEPNKQPQCRAGEAEFVQLPVPAKVKVKFKNIMKVSLLWRPSFWEVACSPELTWETINKHPTSVHILHLSSTPTTTSCLLLPASASGLLLWGAGLYRRVFPAFSVLTSGDRVIFGVIGDFITGVIFADTGAVVITTDTRVKSSKSFEFRAVNKGRLRVARAGLGLKGVYLPIRRAVACSAQALQCIGEDW